MDVVKFVLKLIATAVVAAVAVVVLFPNSPQAYAVSALWNRFLSRGGDETIVVGLFLLVLLWGVIHLINKLPGGGEKKK